MRGLYGGPGAATTALVAQTAATLETMERFIERGTAEFRLANVALFAAGFTTFALIYCVQPVMPVFSLEFGVDAATASLALSATTQCLAVSMLFTSSLSEVFGRKPVMLISLFASSGLMIGSAFAPNWSTLLIMRALAGLAFSGLPATAMAYVGEEMEARSTGLAMGLYIGGTGLGALGGRFIVGIMTDLWSWRAGLFTIGVLALASSVVFLLYLPASRHFRPKALDARGLLGSFGAHLRNKVQCVLYAEGFLLLGVFVALYNDLGYRLMAPPYRFGQTAVSLVFGLALVGILSSAFVGDLASRLGRGRVFWVLVLLILVGVLVTLLPEIIAILGGMALVTFAFYGAHAIASSWVGMEAEAAKAQASSLYLFAYYSGSSLIGWLGGFMWQTIGWPGDVALCSLVLVLAFGLALTLPRAAPA
jgi:YNFM family putative membrane transporter